MQCDFRSQNNQPLSKCEIINQMSSSDSAGLNDSAKRPIGLAGLSNWEYRDRGGGLIVSCSKPQRALVAGQYAVFYRYYTFLLAFPICVRQLAYYNTISNYANFSIQSGSYYFDIFY